MDNNDSKTVGICPVCGKGRVIEKEQGFGCNNRSCGFFIHKEIKRTAITAETARKLITEGKSDVMKFTNAFNNPFFARLIREGDTIRVDFDNDFLDGKCPLCGGRVQITKNGYNCENRVSRKKGEKKYGNGWDISKKCSFHMNKRLCNREITKEEAERFLDGEKEILDDFLSTAGNEFSGYLELSEAGYVRTCSRVSVCPICGGVILVGTRGFNCSNFKTEGCRMKIPRRVAGHDVTLEDVRQLCERDDHTTDPVDIRQANGEVIKRRLTFDENFETITI